MEDVTQRIDEHNAASRTYIFYGNLLKWLALSGYPKQFLLERSVFEDYEDVRDSFSESVRLWPYSLDRWTLLKIEQIIPLREGQQYTARLKEKKEEVNGQAAESIIDFTQAFPYWHTAQLTHCFVTVDWRRQGMFKVWFAQLFHSIKSAAFALKYCLGDTMLKSSLKFGHVCLFPAASWSIRTAALSILASVHPAETPRRPRPNCLSVRSVQPPCFCWQAPLTRPRCT
jgi:hypothetical protein